MWWTAYPSIRIKKINISYRSILCIRWSRFLVFIESIPPSISDLSIILIFFVNSIVLIRFEKRTQQFSRMHTSRSSFKYIAKSFLILQSRFITSIEYAISKRWFLFRSVQDENIIYIYIYIYEISSAYLHRAHDFSSIYLISHIFHSNGIAWKPFQSDRTRINF